jgi:hypothetical protein
MRSHSIAIASLAAVWIASASARADGLSAAEAGQLVSGATVARTQAFERSDQRYVGGVTYTILDARAGELAELLDDVDGWKHFLPKTRNARHVGGAGGDTLVEVTHGSSLLQVTYTMRVRRDGNIVRFWMDPLRPHGIKDVWGFFRTEPFSGGRTLVTYGILIDMGEGLLRTLFEDRVRELALTVPQRVRGLLLERRTSGYDESSLVREAATRY